VAQKSGWLQRDEPPLSADLYVYQICHELADSMLVLVYISAMTTATPALTYVRTIVSKYSVFWSTTCSNDLYSINNKNFTVKIKHQTPRLNATFAAA